LCSGESTGDDVVDYVFGVGRHTCAMVYLQLPHGKQWQRPVAESIDGTVQGSINWE